MAGGAQLGDGGDDESTISEINVTPLVDIILVVLIIFMVTAQVITRGIEVKSPETATGSEVASTLALTLTASGDLYLNGEPMGNRTAEVQTYIAGLVKSKPDIQAVITADRAVPHGRVMEIVDLVKLAKVKSIAFTTEKKATQ